MRTLLMLHALNLLKCTRLPHKHLRQNHWLREIILKKYKNGFPNHKHHEPCQMIFKFELGKSLPKSK